MKYGYIDESGAPGVAVNSNDFLVVSLVLFDSEDDVKECEDAMKRLRIRLGLKPSYEFHCSHNMKAAQDGMLRLLSRQKFRFITIAIKKNQIKKHASYSRMAQLLAREMRNYCEDARLRMDSNPVLFKALKKELHGLSVSLREVKSHTDDLIQLADYVVNLSAKMVKNTEKAAVLYRRSLAQKQLVFIEICD